MTSLWSRIGAARGKRHLMVVSRLASVHTARWLDLVDRSRFRVTLFPVDHHRIFPTIQDVDLIRPRLVERATQEQAPQPKSRPPQDASRSGWRRLFGDRRPDPQSEPEPSVRFVDLPLAPDEFAAGDPRTVAEIRLGESEQMAPAMYGPDVLAAAIERFKPDMVHSMEFQHCGYLVLAARSRFGSDFPAWIASNWGSDIYHFRNFEGHRQQIVRLLTSLDCFATECQRDVTLARDLGYSGTVLPLLHVPGGLDLALCSRLRSAGAPSQRRVVIMKGYEHFAGRALTTLDILRRNADLLAGYEIVCISVTPNVRDAIAAMQGNSPLRIRALPDVPHAEVLAQYGRARVYIGLSISDGMPASVVESMAMGCFPIQTNTSCCDEWFADGEGGFVVDLNDPEEIGRRLRQALTDDRLVDKAAELNWKVACERLALGVVKRQVAEFYELARKRPD